jgi:hypothetical protein
MGDLSCVLPLPFWPHWRQSFSRPGGGRRSGDLRRPVVAPHLQTTRSTSGTWSAGPGRGRTEPESSAAEIHRSPQAHQDHDDLPAQLISFRRPVHPRIDCSGGSPCREAAIDTEPAILSAGASSDGDGFFSGGGSVHSCILRARRRGPDWAVVRRYRREPPVRVQGAARSTCTVCCGDDGA